ncbi:hypothetical protein BGZ79_010649 [Entomortierella chlamydospora]|nr:hypothetical protein BGZ79_010649 [Entomortierella chlamydospora]
MTNVKMTEVNQNEQSQAFRDCSSSEVYVIPTRVNKLGEHIILWEDVRQVFGPVKTVLNGKNAVLPMTDEQFQYLTPLRIPHYPGVVLDIVAEKGTITSNDTPQIVTTDPTPKAEQNTAINHIIEKDAQLSVELESRIIVQPSTAENTHLAVWEPTLATKNPFNPDKRTSITPTTPQEFHQVYGSYFQDLMVGQVIQTSTLKDAMNKHFDSLQVEMYKNAALQARMLQLQQQMEEKQQKLIQMQHLTLNRLALIQNHVQLMLTQTYELHEYPIPRLFIVLPIPGQQRNELGRLQCNQFRLYFLCECGEHTMTPRSNTHEVHLALHEGYDLEQPSVFFEKYASYVLTLMQMFKYGVTTSGLVVPALDKFRIGMELDSIQNVPGGTNDKIDVLVDETISFLEECRDIAADDIDREGRSNSEQPLVLDSADLRQLESYLSIKDHDQALGNLYRVVTPEGHVKWVCIDHYHENYQESTILSLKEIVMANKGTIAEEEGRVEIKLTTGSQAKRFYQAMTKAPGGVQELKITLDWNVHLDDLRKLASAVTEAKVTHLTIDGFNFKGPARDVINRNRRYDPILQLMSNGSMRSLKIINFHNFFGHITSNSISMSPQQRVLWIDSNIKVGEKSFSSNLEKIIENCPSLTELRLKPLQTVAFIDLLVGKFNKALRFEFMTLRREGKDPEICMEFTRQMVRSSSVTLITNGRSILPKTDKQQRSTRPRLAVKINLDNWYDLLTIFRCYGWSIKELQIGGVFDDRHAKALSDSMADAGSKLSSLLVSTAHLTQGGLDGLLQVLDCSRALEILDLVFDIQDDSSSLKKLTSLIQRHRKRLHSLTVRGSYAGRWIPELAISFPSMQWFPRLESLEIVSKDRVLLSKSCIQWINDMVSGSSHGPMPPGSPQQTNRMSIVIPSQPHAQPPSPRSPILESPSGPLVPSRSPRVPNKFPIAGSSSDSLDLSRSPQRLSRTSVIGSSSDSLDLSRSRRVSDRASVGSSSDSLLFPGSPRLSNRNSLAVPSSESNRLKEFVLDGAKLQPEDWFTLIKALNFTTLERLGLPRTNFSFDQLRTLIACIEDATTTYNSLVILKTLDFRDTRISIGGDVGEQRALEKLEKLVSIVKLK